MVRRRKKFKFISLRKKRRGRQKKKYWKLILVLVVMFIVIPVVIGYMWFKKNILDGLPPISNIEKVVFSQTTTITDRN
jgi:ribose/xylose/arabinose/galactoside ABC-type transport system permease subunit